MKMEDKKILVTGGAGYIGSHTVVQLYKEGYTPVIVDDLRNSSERVIEGISKITGEMPLHYRIDINDFDAFEHVFKANNFIGIIHFAADKAVGESVDFPLKYYRNNLTGLLNCLDLVAKYKVPNFVFSSSCTVYGEPDGSTNVSEDTPIKIANSPYGATKQMCERILLDLHKSGSGLNVLCLRYFNPIGAHESSLIGELPLGKPNNLLPFVTQTAIGKIDCLTVFGNDYNTEDGTCIRDYIHVIDLVNAHIKGVEWLDNQEKGVYEVLNIGTGKGVSVLEIINTFEHVSGVKLNWKFGPRRSGDVEQIFANSKKANDLINWTAAKSVEDAVRDAWNWEKYLNSED